MATYLYAHQNNTQSATKVKHVYLHAYTGPLGKNARLDVDGRSAKAARMRTSGYVITVVHALARAHAGGGGGQRAFFWKRLAHARASWHGLPAPSVRLISGEPAVKITFHGFPIISSLAFFTFFFRFFLDFFPVYIYLAFS